MNLCDLCCSRCRADSDLRAGSVSPTLYKIIHRNNSLRIWHGLRDCVFLCLSSNVLFIFHMCHKIWAEYLLPENEFSLAMNFSLVFSDRTVADVYLFSYRHLFSPDNSNLYMFPLKVRVIGSQMQLLLGFLDNWSTIIPVPCWLAEAVCWCERKEKSWRK